MQSRESSVSDSQEWAYKVAPLLSYLRNKGGNQVYYLSAHMKVNWLLFFMAIVSLRLVSLSIVMSLSGFIATAAAQTQVLIPDSRE